VVTERLGRKLRIFAIEASGALREITSGRPIVLDGPGDQGAPMGVALYRRPTDGAVFAIVAPKSGPTRGYLWQFRLADDGTGRVGATFVRRLGDFSGTGEIEAITVDDELGFVYYADEVTGIHKWHADPDVIGADRELALFATTGYQQDREGLAIYAGAAGAGYIVSVDQLPGESIVHLYKREGEPGRPHDHSSVVRSFRMGADGTDGLEATSAPLGEQFPRGLLILMNSGARNFLIADWRTIEQLGLKP
jgi:3-phytase